jgi:oligopeptide/dipeptide ABC transporter ATP-binding protein
MSSLFITHDLSAAYYLGGDIMVMARGRIVEEGPVDAVMSQPAHPYTQLLLQSIPSPNPDQRWDLIERTRNTATPALMLSRNRCLFAERCPHVMDVCWQARPPMYVAGSQRAACYLHQTATPVSTRGPDAAGVPAAS